MARESFGERYRRDPRSTLVEAGVFAGAYVVLGLLRPRWLTSRGRRGWRHWLWRIPVQAVVVTAAQVWLGPWIERSKHAQEELRLVLGRDPTPEELMARLKELEDRS